MNDAAIEVMEPKRQPRQPPPPGESKRQKFERLASARTKRAIKAIRIIGAMGGKNRYSYEFNKDDVARITSTLGKELMQLGAVMVPPDRELDIEFDFK